MIGKPKKTNGDPAPRRAGRRGRPPRRAVIGRPKTTNGDPARVRAERRAGTTCGTLIESLGVYLPPRSVTTKEVIRGCKRMILFPLEKMTGIHSRRMAGDGEYSIDLARKAV